MKTLLRTVSVISAGVLLVSACLNRTTAETDPKIIPSTESITVPAEFTTLEDSVKMVSIKANRSWFVHLNDASGRDPKNPEDSLDWVYSNVREHVNMTKVGDETEVALTFHRNRTSAEKNGFADIWSGGERVARVRIRQLGAQFSLKITPNKTTVNCDPDSVIVKVECNTDWSASLVEGETTADAYLKDASGYDPGEFKVMFRDNMDVTSSKTATVEIKANECETQTLVITQSKAIPYLRVDADKNPPVIKPGINETIIEASTNIPDVKAEVVSATLSDVQVEKLDMKRFKVSFVNPSDDPHVLKDAKLKFSTAEPGIDPVEHTFSQAGVLKWVFSDGVTLNFFGLPTVSPAKPGIPTSESKAMDPLVTSAGSYRLYQAGFVYGRTSSASSGVILNGGNGTNYILLPAIEGYVMSKITLSFIYHSSVSKGTKMSIKPANGLTYSDDKSMASFSVTSTEYLTGTYDTTAFISTGDKTTVHTFVLGKISEEETDPGKEIKTPEANTAYCIYHSSRNCVVRTITLVYEPVINE